MPLANVVSLMAIEIIKDFVACNLTTIITPACEICRKRYLCEGVRRNSRPTFTNRPPPILVMKVDAQRTREWLQEHRNGLMFEVEILGSRYAIYSEYA